MWIKLFFQIFNFYTKSVTFKKWGENLCDFFQILNFSNYKNCLTWGWQRHQKSSRTLMMLALPYSPLCTPLNSFSNYPTHQQLLFESLNVVIKHTNKLKHRKIWKSPWNFFVDFSQLQLICVFASLKYTQSTALSCAKKLKFARPTQFYLKTITRAEI